MTTSPLLHKQDVEILIQRCFCCRLGRLGSKGLLEEEYEYQACQSAHRLCPNQVVNLWLSVTRFTPE